MPHPQSVVLLYGGRSGEHEISLISAASVLANLDSKRYKIIPIGMDKNGCCYVNTLESLLPYTTSLPVKTAASKPLASLIVDGKFALDVDVIFPVMHGPLYEDGCLQGLLSLANVAYVGCDVLSSALGMDKDMARRIASMHGISAARYRLISSYTQEEKLQNFARNAANDLGWPLFVKPCSMGSSVGIHKVNNHLELMEALHDARRYDESVLVEEFIQGREIELAVLESIIPSEEPKVSVAGEICVNHPDGFYSYTAKYLESNSSTLQIPAMLSSDLLLQLQSAAKIIFAELKCKGLARIDFFVNDITNCIYFNEINTLPGFTSISMYPKLWEATGIPYAILLEKLIDLALMHQKHRQQRITNYQ